MLLLLPLDLERAVVDECTREVTRERKTNNLKAALCGLDVCCAVLLFGDCPVTIGFRGAIRGRSTIRLRLALKVTPKLLEVVLRRKRCILENFLDDAYELECLGRVEEDVRVWCVSDCRWTLNSDFTYPQEGRCSEPGGLPRTQQE
jgi:hypothetical protein